MTQFTTTTAILLSIFLLSSCASDPKFQKKSGDLGYEVTQISDSEFEVSVSLPENTSPRFKDEYMRRAAGETCLEKNMKYWDQGPISPDRIAAFCYSENVRKAIAVAFESDGLKENPPKFIIEDLNNKNNTKLQVSDQVLKIGDRSMKHMGDVKSIVHRWTLDKKSSIPMEIVRAGETSTVDEPLATFTGGHFTPEMLQRLQSWMK